MITVEDIRQAYGNIKSYIHETPLIHSNSFSKLTDAQVHIKAENLQKTGSFKVRGAFNKMVHMKGSKVIAASMGNHAQGVACAAQALGKLAKIIMPVNAPIIKQEATRGYGAEVLIHGQSFQEAMDFAQSQKDYAFIHAYDDDCIIAGQGTVGLELMEKGEPMDCVLVPVGGGGLIAGISIAVKSISPKTQVIGIQTESAASAYFSFREKKITGRPPMTTLADGIAIGQVGIRTLDVINTYVDDIVMVSEDSIAMAILLFLERKKLVVEGSGAVPLAALIENKERFRGKRIVLIVSGGNIDFTLIDQIIRKGLVSSGRIGTFDVIVRDIPGSLHALTGGIASKGGNILNVVHHRFAQDLSIGKAKLVFTIETRGRKHLDEIMHTLGKEGYELRIREL
ncbi:MAG: threonine ammonia-lyase [Nitrospiraceae bacterium]|nr:MAG: threonine ammonia-lyase [Nitrospiraceae bacterium]